MMTDYENLFKQAVRSLAAIDDALGIGDDGCGDLDQTLTEIANLKKRAEIANLKKRAGDATCKTCEALARAVMLDQTGSA